MKSTLRCGWSQPFLDVPNCLNAWFFRTQITVSCSDKAIIFYLEIVQNSYYQMAILTVKKTACVVPSSMGNHTTETHDGWGYSVVTLWTLAIVNRNKSLASVYQILSCSVWLQLVNSFSRRGFPTERYYNWVDNWGLCSWPRTQQEINHRYNQQCVIQARYNNHKPPKSDRKSVV